MFERVMKQIVMDGVFWVCVYFGLYLGIEGAETALIFALWILSTIIWVCAFAISSLNDEQKMKIAEDAKGKPTWFSFYGTASSWIEAMVLAAFGHYILATVYLLGSLFMKVRISAITDEYEVDQ